MDSTSFLEETNQFVVRSIIHWCKNRIGNTLARGLVHSLPQRLYSYLNVCIPSFKNSPLLTLAVWHWLNTNKAKESYFGNGTSTMARVSKSRGWLNTQKRSFSFTKHHKWPAIHTTWRVLFSLCKTGPRGETHISAQSFTGRPDRATLDLLQSWGDMMWPSRGTNRKSGSGNQICHKYHGWNFSAYPHPGVITAK